MKKTSVPKLKGKDFYKKMLDAKKAKADKVKREKPDLVAPKVQPDPYTNVPEKATDMAQEHSSVEQKQHTEMKSLLNKAVERIREQSKGL